MDEDRVFRALADPHRRLLLDRLFERDGRTLWELQQQLPMTRFGVMKHLRTLEAAGLITTRKLGREKLHYLNPVPVQRIYDRWVSKYTARRSAALLALKAALEETDEGAVTSSTAGATAVRPQQVYQVFIKAAPEQVWQAITTPEFSRRYFFGTELETDAAPGSPLRYHAHDRSSVMVEGEVLEAERPRRLVHSWHMLYKPELAADPPSRVTWEIEPLGNGVSRLTVTHDGFERETDTYREVAGGWSLVLSGLKTLLETGEPLSLPM